MSNYDEIDEGTARRIASEWHGGQWSPLYMFSSSGATQDSRYDLSDIIHEVEQNIAQTASASALDELSDLRDYLRGLES